MIISIISFVILKYNDDILFISLHLEETGGEDKKSTLLENLSTPPPPPHSIAAEDIAVGCPTPVEKNFCFYYLEIFCQYSHRPTMQLHFARKKKISSHEKMSSKSDTPQKM